MGKNQTNQDLLKRIKDLEERLSEADEIIHAIRGGSVDALVIQDPDGEKLYTLKGADHGYRVLVESITEGALILSSANSIYYCNRCFGEMLGIPLKKIIGTTLDTYIESGGRTELALLIDETRSIGSAKGEFLIRQNGGAFLPVNLSLNHVSLGDFDVVCAIVTDLSGQKLIEEELRRHRTELEVLVDDRTADLVRTNTALQQEITERKLVEEELSRARDGLELRVSERTAELSQAVAKLESMNQELQEFAFIASHDLQEPLRKIQTFGSMLVRKHRESLDPEAQDYLGRVTKAANRMSELLRSLLSYSRSGTSQLNYKPVSLTEVVRDAVSDLGFLINKAKGSVEISELPTVDADAAQLRQLFQNIIENSMKYRKESEPPIVKIHGEVDDSVCRVFVEDNGIGFEECYRKQIFKPFERLHGKNSPYGGTGMGLAICRKIVTRHNGQITVNSIPGQGTTFIVALPTEQETWA